MSDQPNAPSLPVPTVSVRPAPHGRVSVQLEWADAGNGAPWAVACVIPARQLRGDPATMEGALAFALVAQIRQASDAPDGVAMSATLIDWAVVAREVARVAADG